MKTVLFHTHGGPEVLEYTDFPTPSRDQGRCWCGSRPPRSTGWTSWCARAGPGIKLEYPHIPGADGAGEIAALGAGVSGWQDRRPGGDQFQPELRRSARTALPGRTTAASAGSCWARRCAAPMPSMWSCRPQRLSPARRRYDMSGAAAAALVFHTAWHSLITRANLRAGRDRAGGRRFRRGEYGLASRSPSLPGRRCTWSAPARRS